MYYMMSADGRRIGPVEASELVNHGLTSETLVWRPDFSQWIPAAHVPELNAFLAVPPTPPFPPVSGPNNYSQPNIPPHSGGSFANQTFNQQQCGMTVKPDNYMVWAILSTLLCCLPLGFVSILYAGKVNDYWNNGRYVEAKDASDKARMWAMISAGGGLFIGLISFILALAS